MKGKNEFLFCQDQMVEIVQAYMDEHLLKDEQQSPQVISVHETGDSYHRVFTIELENPEPVEKK